MQPEIIAQTDTYFVINKPAGLAVEPPSHQPTLVDWLINNNHINPSDWSETSRYGVVHRLDTDTSGVMLWAKTQAAQEELKTLWQGRQVEKTYLALVAGQTDATGTIELAIKRNNSQDKMTVVWLQDGSGRAAITTYKTLASANVTVPNLDVRSQLVSLVEAHPVTGRTHQIRVHFKAIGHPLIADKLYGEKRTDQIAKQLGLNRHFLHASQICLPQAGSEQKVCYQAPLPEDLQQSLATLNIEHRH